jgi:hypothetical protein
MKTIAQQLNVKDFPFIIRDNDGVMIYWEESDGFWERWEYDSSGREKYFEDSTGFKRELDFKKNEIVCSSPNGLAKGYDENGNMVFFDDSPQQ